MSFDYDSDNIILFKKLSIRTKPLLI